MLQGGGGALVAAHLQLPCQCRAAAGRRAVFACAAPTNVVQGRGSNLSKCEGRGTTLVSAEGERTLRPTKDVEPAAGG